jgi:hypothetical protein
MIVVALSTFLRTTAMAENALRPNHSVKPTRSGLRPPRAAYLKRYASGRLSWRTGN